MKRVIINEERCKGCSLCVSVCPKKILCISPDKMNAAGYRPAVMIEGAECIGCASCAVMCPDAAISVTAE